MTSGQVKRVISWARVWVVALLPIAASLTACHRK